MIKVESILKWKVEGSLLKKLKMVRAQILSKNSDAVAISDSDLHITLASGSGWQKLRGRIKAKDFDEPEVSIDIDPIVKVMEKGGSKSWYVKLKNQQDVQIDPSFFSSPNSSSSYLLLSNKAPFKIINGLLFLFDFL